MEVDNSTGQNRVRNHGRKGIFGDPFLRTKSKSIRILLHNVGGIGFVTGQRSRETLKMEKLKELVCRYGVDLISLSEVNKDWRKIQTNNTIWEGTKAWQEHRRVQVSQNTTQRSEKEFLVGGTAMCAFNELVFKICQQGQDERKLGCWSLFTIQGKHYLKTTFITCYCPVRGNDPGSAYAQQLTYIANNRTSIPDSIECPRQLFGYDLKTLMDSLTAEGIVVNQFLY